MCTCVSNCGKFVVDMALQMRSKESKPQSGRVFKVRSSVCGRERLDSDSALVRVRFERTRTLTLILIRGNRSLETFRRARP